MTLAETNEQLKEAAKSAKQRAQAIIDKGNITTELSKEIWDTAVRGKFTLNLSLFLEYYIDKHPTDFDGFVKHEIKELLKGVLNKNGFTFNSEYNCIVWNHLLPK